MAVHLWESKVFKSIMATLTEGQLRSGRTCFFKIGGAILDGSFDFGAASLRGAERQEESLRAPLSRSLKSLVFQNVHVAPPAPAGCADGDGRCAGWAAAGECEKNAQFMLATCRRACGKCAA